MPVTEVCERCGRKLGEGMTIVHIGTFLGQDHYNLCGTCTANLKKWLRDQSKRFNRPA